MKRIPSKTVRHEVIGDDKLVPFHGVVEIDTPDEGRKFNQHLLILTEQLLALDSINYSSTVDVFVDCTEMKFVPHVHHKPKVTNVVTPVFVP